MPFQQWILVLVGVSLQVLLISAALRRATVHPLVLIYAVVLFLTTVVETSALVQRGDWAGIAQTYYWLGELIRQVLIFAIIISLAYRRLTSVPELRKHRPALLGFAALLVVISVAASSGPTPNSRFTDASRNLSFCAMVLNLVLWGILIRDRVRSHPESLLISGGLGIQMAGQAIGQSMRQMWQISRNLVWVGNWVIVLSHLLSLYVLWRAMAPEKKIAPVAQETNAR